MHTTLVIRLPKAKFRPNCYETLISKVTKRSCP